MIDRKIYVLCPANVITGGTDALHQFVYYCKQIGLDASVVYYSESDDSINSICKPYQGYTDSA